MAAEQSNDSPAQPTAPPSTLPLYPEMILTAIEALNDPNGSNKSAISRQIDSTYGDLPAAHMTLLSHHLNKMKQSGQLTMVKNNYMKPDPNAPPPKGRGRPPKSKSPLSPDAVASSPESRGPPPKATEPLTPASEKSKTPSSGRPRGRPPKKAKTEGTAEDVVVSAPPPPPPSGTPARGRGRPPKVKPQVSATPVEC